MRMKPTFLSLTGQNVKNFEAFLSSLKKPDNVKNEKNNMKLLNKWKSEEKYSLPPQNKHNQREG